MTEVRTVARQIQQLEIYLNNLVSALTRGELPVNLQPVTQIFDNAIAFIPPILNLPQAKFIELYNDLPHLFAAYAIDVTLSEDSYHRQNNEIIFHRFTRGNYWIVPIQSAPEQGWLVPNPLKGLSLDRIQSLDTSFDRDISPDHSNNNCILVTPALVQILPIVEPLTWKLLERGKLTNTQNKQSAITTNVIDSLVERLSKLNDRIVQIEQSSIKLDSNTSVDKQAQLQSIVAKIVEQLATKQQEILALKTQLTESNDRSTRQDREIAALKVQMDSILQKSNLFTTETNKVASTDPVADQRELVSLKVELERLKADYQSYQRQQANNQRDLIANVKVLIAKEIDNIQPQIETIDGEIIALDPVPQQQTSPLQAIHTPIVDKVLSPFASLYNSGEKNFLRSYMVSTANLRRSNNNNNIIELIEDNVGHYWIVPFDHSTHYLVPKMDFLNYSKCLEVLALLFDGANDCTNFTLFKPAIVSITKANMPKQWKLEQKGYLDAAPARQ